MFNEKRSKAKSVVIRNDDRKFRLWAQIIFNIMLMTIDFDENPQRQNDHSHMYRCAVTVNALL
jgi:hypothetical protein